MKRKVTMQDWLTTEDKRWGEPEPEFAFFEGLLVAVGFSTGMAAFVALLWMVYG